MRPVLCEALHDVAQGKHLAILVGHAAQGGQEDIFARQIVQPLQGTSQSLLCDERHAQTIWDQLTAQLTLDRLIGVAAIPDKNEIVGILVQVEQPFDIGPNLLAFKNTGKKGGIETASHAVVIHPGKENGYAGEDAGEVVTGKQQGVIVGDIDRRRLVTRVLQPQMTSHLIRVSLVIGTSFGIQILGADIGIHLRILCECLYEALVLTPGPGVFLRIGMQHKNLS